MGAGLKPAGGATQEKGMDVYCMLIMDSALISVNGFESLCLSLNPWFVSVGLVYFSPYQDVLIVE